MLEYRKKHGNLSFKRNCGGDEAKLRTWIFTQRKLLRCGKMSSRRIALLKAADFDWKPGIVSDSKWEKMYNLVVAFFEANGHLAVPARKHEIGAWMCRQRVTRRRGKLSQDRIDRLNKLPFSWSGTEVEFDDAQQYGWENAHPNQFAKEWHAKLKELTEHKEKFGHLRVSRGYNQPLTQWIFRQRRLYAEGMLCKERVSNLNSIGFTWRPRKGNVVSPSDERWYDMYERLKAFKQKHGHFDIVSQGKNDHKLAKWVSVQMSAQWTSHPERKAMLEEIGFPLEQCDPAPSLPSTRAIARELKTSDSTEQHQDHDVTTEAGKPRLMRPSRKVSSDRESLDEAKHDVALMGVSSTRDRPTMKASTRDDSATTKAVTEKRKGAPKTPVLPQQTDCVFPVATQILNFFPGQGWFIDTVQTVERDKYTDLNEHKDTDKVRIGGPTMMDATLELVKSCPAQTTAIGSGASAPMCDRDQCCSGDGRKRPHDISKEGGMSNKRPRLNGIQLSEEARNQKEGEVAVEVLERNIATLKAKCAELETLLKRSKEAVAVANAMAMAKAESTRLQRLVGELNARIEILEGVNLRLTPWHERSCPDYWV